MPPSTGWVNNLLLPRSGHQLAFYTYNCHNTSIRSSSSPPPPPHTLCLSSLFVCDGLLRRRPIMGRSTGLSLSPIIFALCSPTTGVPLGSTNLLGCWVFRQSTGQRLCMACTGGNATAMLHHHAAA